MTASPVVPTPQARCVSEFTQGNQLRFVDPRTFGEIFVVDPARLPEAAPDLADLGWDPLEDPLPWGDFARLVLSRSLTGSETATLRKLYQSAGPEAVASALLNLDAALTR